MTSPSRLLAKSFITAFAICAAFHMILLGYIAIREQDPVIWNLFNILDLDYFFPNMIYGFWSQVASVVTMIVLVGGAYLYWTKKETRS